MKKKPPHRVSVDLSSELDTGSRSGQDIGGAVDDKRRATVFWWAKSIGRRPLNLDVIRLKKHVQQEFETPMANALILEAPPAMFDDFVSIFDDTEFNCSTTSSNSIVRGVRRMDAASYDITDGSSCVHIITEKRLGNPTMFVAITPTRRTFWRRDGSSERLAEQIVELLVAHGADDSP